MTISSLLARSVNLATLLLGLSGCVVAATPMALQEWEEELSEAAIHACTEQGGFALVGADRVVSCAPGAVANRWTP